METLLTEEKLEHIRAMLATTKHVHGDVIEVGVYQGGSLKAIRDAVSLEKNVIGYDTFSGLPAPTHVDLHREGQFCFKDIESVQSRVGSATKLVKGLFPESDITRKQGISFAHLDVDLFESTLASLLHVDLFLSLGGVIVIDDYQWGHCPGVKLAVDKFLDSSRTAYGDYSMNANSHFQCTLLKVRQSYGYKAL